MAHVYVQSTKNANLRWKVISYDPETKIGELQGGFNVTFKRSLAKDKLEEMGYEIVQSEEELPVSGGS